MLPLSEEKNKQNKQQQNEPKEEVVLGLDVQSNCT